MRAPFAREPFTTATAELPARFASDFVRLTSWLVPNASCAGRFSFDITADTCCWLGFGFVVESCGVQVG